jgi:hypothetical protein
MRLGAMKGINKAAQPPSNYGDRATRAPFRFTPKTLERRTDGLNSKRSWSLVAGYLFG